MAAWTGAASLRVASAASTAAAAVGRGAAATGAGQAAAPSVLGKSGSACRGLCSGRVRRGTASTSLRGRQWRDSPAQRRWPCLPLAVVQATHPQQARSMMMMASSRKKKNVTAPANSKPVHHVTSAIRLVKENALKKPRKFDETVEVALHLGVDPRKPNQTVRGTVSLPSGTGKKTVIAVFAKGDSAEEARAAGADIVGADDLVEQIQAGQINFDKCVATPDVMGLVGRCARQLGPRGLMPNPKLGTVTRDVQAAVAALKGGQVDFRAGKLGLMHAGIGKVSFSVQELQDNLRAFMLAVTSAKPEGAKGKYVRNVSLSSSMGPGVKVALETADPSSPRFMLDEELYARMNAQGQ